MTAVNLDDVSRMREQRQRREARKKALHPLRVKRLTNMMLWGSVIIDPKEDAAAVDGLPPPAELLWGPVLNNNQRDTI